MNPNEAKTGIVAALGTTQTAEYCLRLFDALLEINEEEGNFLTFSMLQRMADCYVINPKFIEAVQFLTSSTFSLLHAHGQFVDDNGAEYTLSDVEFDNVLLYGSLIHPRTGEQIEDARKDVIPFFSLINSNREKN